MPRLQFNDLAALMRLHPLWVSCATLSVLLAGTSVFLWQDIKTLNKIYQERSTEGQAVLATVALSSPLRRELTLVRETVRRIDDNLFVESDLPGNYVYFDIIKTKARCQSIEPTPLSSAPAPAEALYKSVPYTLKVTGTYEQTAGFLHGIETGPRLVKITSFSFNRREVASPSILLELSVELLCKI
ncbi:MAG: type 4a pilus biogenesis protein PilO [Opitutaceae bacterium]|nr:type 4a pilus biogenesis protein PilO [Opitutaceae bacterium]